MKLYNPLTSQATLQPVYIMTHHNNHARSKQKRKALRQQNTRKRIHDKKLQKLMNNTKPKGRTVYGEAKKQAIDIRVLFPNEQIFWNPGPHGKNLNQRQKRKRLRWA